MEKGNKKGSIIIVICNNSKSYTFKKFKKKENAYSLISQFFIFPNIQFIDFQTNKLSDQSPHIPQLTVEGDEKINILNKEEMMSSLPEEFIFVNFDIQNLGYHK